MAATARNRTLAVVLAVLALTTVSPIVAVSYVWSGGSWLAMTVTTTRSWLTAAVAVALIAAPAIVGMLLVASVGVWRNRRWAVIPGWLGLAGSVLVIWGPLAAVSPTSWWWPLRVASALLTVVGALGLARFAPHSEKSSSAPLLWSVVGFLAAVLACTVLAGVIGGLPNDPGAWWGDDFATGDGRPEAFDAAVVQNTTMATFPWAAIHNDAAQSDAYPGRPTVDPRTGVLRSFVSGGVCASIAWDSQGDLVAVCVSEAVRAFVIDPNTMSARAEYTISPRPFSPDFLTDFSGGGYMYLDSRDAIVTPTVRQTLLVVEQRRQAGSVDLIPGAEYDLRGALQGDEPVTSALPDSSGRIWFVGARGTVGFIEPTSGTVVSRTWVGENIENSFATGVDDDVYVVTSTALRRLEADGGVRVVWEAPYDAGSERKPGQTSRASGTTPTLHGDGLVSIADNGSTMHVDVFRQETGERLCHVPVFTDVGAATENTLVALGSDLLVENNYGYRLLDVIGGHTTVAGLARVDISGDGECAVRWTNTELAVPSLVTKASAAGGVALTYAKKSRWWGVDDWWITAVGLGDGGIVWERRAGAGSARNNHYAALYMSPDGAIVVGTTMGILALTDR